MPRRPKSSPELQPRLRVVCGENIALGPGKADLLELIARTGSINQAAQSLGMSYMRAWTLVKTMNAAFRQPVVVTARGGAERGGAIITDDGRAALALYRSMEDTIKSATSKQWQSLRRMLA